jgi:hypothetical protein
MLLGMKTLKTQRISQRHGLKLNKRKTLGTAILSFHFMLVD